MGDIRRQRGVTRKDRVSLAKTGVTCAAMVTDADIRRQYGVSHAGTGCHTHAQG